MTVRLQREDFDANAEVAALTRGSTDIGAVVTFTGICRGAEAGEPIAALTLEHYPGMAETEIARHVEAANARWHLLGSVAGLVIADTALVLPFSILLLRPFARAVPKVLYEAAALDGASSAQIFLRIVIPLLRNGIATVASIVFITVWGEFIYATNFLTEGSQLPVSALLAEQISIYSANWNRLMALALLTSLPLLAVFLFAQRRLTAGLTLGAVR